MNDYLIMLNFVGLFFLLIANSVHNFYLSKKMHRLLRLMGEGSIVRKERKKNTLEKMIEKGMELEGRTV